MPLHHLTSLGRATLFVVLLVLILPLSVSSAAAAVSDQVFSHSEWTAVLEKFVDTEGRVDYQGLFESRASFDRYLESIETLGPETTPNLFPTRNHALAYYLNAYNSQIFAGVLSRGPEKESVWRGLVSGLNFFVRMKVEIDGKRTNLKKFEEKVILRQFKDPRVHAALNCASIGCPRLPQQAFEAETLDAQLNAAMTEWVSDERHCQVDEAARVVRLNKIFDWFSSDFLAHEKAQGVSKPNQIDYVNRFRAAGAQIPRDYKIQFLPYDKGINAQ